jgi:membrane-associated protease RseP (regulator of RpoE activity)
MTPRRSFHLLLGAIFIPVLTLPVVWGVAIHWLRRATDVEARRWAKRLVGLAVVDTLVVIAAGFLVVRGTEEMEVPTPEIGDRVVIGVRPDVSFLGPGARIESVVEGGPASAAGLQPGDLITRLADEDISGHEALRHAVAALEPGTPVSLEVSRGPGRISVSVTPRRAKPSPGPRLLGRWRPARVLPRPSAAVPTGDRPPRVSRALVANAGHAPRVACGGPASRS